MRATGYLTIVNISPDQWHACISERMQLIGRGSAAQIRLPSKFACVSRSHAQVWADANRLWVRDVGSRSGTRINGVRLEPQQKYQLRLGDRMWLGGVELDATATLESSSYVFMEDDEGDSVCPHDTGNLTSQRRTAELSPELLMQSLTHAEQTIVLWMSRGYTTPEKIAQKLCRSPHTVRTHLNNIFQKLGVHSREEMLGWLKRLDLPDDSGEFSFSPT
jgi:DNA-binding CsgD family transcriptional regulator